MRLQPLNFSKQEKTARPEKTCRLQSPKKLRIEWEKKNARFVLPIAGLLIEIIKRGNSIKLHSKMQ